MYAVIETGGKQYKVAPGDEIQVEKLPGQVGDAIDFNQVILTKDGDNIITGDPYLPDSRVSGKIVRHGKMKKIVVFKYKRRKGYRRTRGHRQHFSLVRINHIEEKP